jgi:RNA polymerase sigma-70 factor (ECF subfamily)
VVATAVRSSLRYETLAHLPRYEFDGAYIQRLVAEDPETESHFSRYFGDLLTLKLRSRLRSQAQVDDAKQETFTRVLTSLKRKNGLATPASLGAFVNSVCNNVLFELYRAGTRTMPLEDDVDLPDDRRPDIVTSIAAGEERMKVRRALESLPDKERELLRWLFFEERDKDMICKDLKIDRNYLRVLVHRAKARFREQFDATEKG